MSLQQMIDSCTRVPSDVLRAAREELQERLVDPQRVAAALMPKPAHMAKAGP
jgi:hypothetical protein